MAPAEGTDCIGAAQMESGESIMEKGDSMEEMSDQRLMALLRELVKQRGVRGAATTLNIDPRTVAASMEGGSLSWRVREAMERGLGSEVGTGASQREGNDSREQRTEGMERRMEALEKEVRSAQEAHTAEAWTEVDRRLDGFAQALREMNGRLTRLEQAREKEPEDVEPRAVDSGREARRVYHSSYFGFGVISKEPHPGEDLSYGSGMPLVEEWRRLMKERAVGTKLTQVKTRQRIMELEIAMLGEYKLTLPPGSSPLDDFTRGAELDWRERALVNIQRERARRALVRWVRRVFTLGLWWK